MRHIVRNKEYLEILEEKVQSRLQFRERYQMLSSYNTRTGPWENLKQFVQKHANTSLELTKSFLAFGNILHYQDDI